jgi:hypothetical protein
VAAFIIIAAADIVCERAVFVTDFELHKLGVTAAEQINISFTSAQFRCR